MEAKEKNSAKRQNALPLLITFLVVVSYALWVLLRMWADALFDLWTDELLVGNLAYDLAHDGLAASLKYYQTPHHMYGTFAYSFVFLFPLFKLFGSYGFWFSFLNWVFGILIFYLWFVLAQKVLGDSQSLILWVLFIAAPPFYVEMMTKSWANHFESAFFFSLETFIAYQMFSERIKSQIWYLVLGVINGFATVLCLSGSIFTIAFGAILFICAVKERKFKRFVSLIVFAVSFLLTFLSIFRLNATTVSLQHRYLAAFFGKSSVPFELAMVLDVFRNLPKLFLFKSPLKFFYPLICLAGFFIAAFKSVKCDDKKRRALFQLLTLSFIVFIAEYSLSSRKTYSYKTATDWRHFAILMPILLFFVLLFISKLKKIGWLLVGLILTFNLIWDAHFRKLRLDGSDIALATNLETIFKLHKGSDRLTFWRDNLVDAPLSEWEQALARSRRSERLFAYYYYGFAQGRELWRSAQLLGSALQSSDYMMSAYKSSFLLGTGAGWASEQFLAENQVDEDEFARRLKDFLFGVKDGESVNTVCVGIASILLSARYFQRESNNASFDGLLFETQSAMDALVRNCELPSDALIRATVLQGFALTVLPTEFSIVRTLAAHEVMGYQWYPLYEHAQIVELKRRLEVEDETAYYYALGEALAIHVAATKNYAPHRIFFVAPDYELPPTLQLALNKGYTDMLNQLSLELDCSDYITLLGQRLCRLVEKPAG